MKVSELQETLKSVNPNAAVEVIAHNRSQKFTLIIGSADGCDKSNCSTWGFYCSALNTSESTTTEAPLHPADRKRMIELLNYIIGCDIPDLPRMQAADLRSALATPASTARTDGWVSVEERLPDDDDGYVDVAVDTKAMQDYAEELPDLEMMPVDVANVLFLKAWAGKFITHWQKRPAAPGSVPQAPTNPEDVPDLYRLAYMPGVWRCPKCEFVLSKATISMSSASIGTTPEDRQSEQCPNDGEWMVPVTYKESLKQCQDRLIQELERGVPQAEPPKEEKIMDKRKAGLFNKFNVERTDGKSAPGQKHEECEYFVLDIDHDPHALPALKAYADSCEAEYPVLANDLRAKLPAGAAQPGDDKQEGK